MLHTIGPYQAGLRGNVRFMLLATLPVLAFYPAFQKCFVQQPGRWRHEGLSRLARERACP
ncbi:hypothetical protein [Streptomyces niphimycinicus]|uniref:hypothetical protein n=1 Tax=Streptomyces niphimycinicus TaxID=2842201 RepID=UPI00209A9A8D|nr:hypothetical protein [Streptomyces niphimycinicus]